MRRTHAGLLSAVALASCTGSPPAPGGAGVVEATILDLPSTLSARVVERPVSQGQAVETGQPLLELDCRRLRARRHQMQAELRAAEAEVKVLGARGEAATTRTTAGRLRAEAKRSQQSALDADLRVAQRDLSRLDEMGRYIPEAEVDRTRTRTQRLEQQLAAARRESTAARQDVRASRGEVDALAAQRQAAVFRGEAMQAQLAQLDLDLEECVVEAPRSGIVEEIFYEVGEVAPAGRPLVRLIDLDKVWVTFYLANQQLGALRPGAAVKIIADAWPEDTFRGRVTTVAAEAEFTPRNIQTRDDRTRLVYPVEVSVENPDHRLRPGMPVEVELGENDASRD
ncbi:MAG: HlyD family efflux transporter periplasmic adaptor subunit [Myxococcota bacterium]